VVKTYAVVAERRAASRWMWVLGALFALPSVAAAQRGPSIDERTLDHALEVSISDDALQAQYIRTLDLGQAEPVDVRGGFFYNEDRDLVLTGDFLARIGDLAERRTVEVRVGTRLYGGFLAVEDQDVFGIGLGGEAEYFLGRDRNTSIKLTLFYAPDIVTFGESDDIKDATLRLQTRLREGTDIFVGFRVFEIDMPVDRELDDNLHLGFRRSF
jgi:hypothetical protein